jgi:hypothetical protein
VCSSNDVGARAEGVRLDLEMISLLFEVFYVFSHIKENMIPLLGKDRFLPNTFPSTIHQ